MSQIPKSITFSIDVNKINKSQINTDEKGRKWLRLRLYNTPDSQYGTDYMVTQDISKEARDAGVKGEILGNAKCWDVSEGRLAPRAEQVTPVTPPANDDLPF